MMTNGVDIVRSGVYFRLQGYYVPDCRLSVSRTE